MIIGVVGLIGSGKSTVANILVEQHGFVRVAFADSLKDAVAVIFGWDRAMLQGDTEDSRQWREQADPYWSQVFGKPITPRWVLQYIGTDVLRDHFHTDIWIHSLMKQVQDPTKNYVISDVRFRNEVDVITKNQGKILEVQRGILPDWYRLAFQDHRSLAAHMEAKHPDVHRSEWDWKLAERSAVIENNGSLHDLGEIVSGIIAV